MESFRLVCTFYHYLADTGSLYKTYGSRERVGPPLVHMGTCSATCESCVGRRLTQSQVKSCFMELVLLQLSCWFYFMAKC